MAEPTPHRDRPRLRPAPLLFEPAEAAADPEHFFDLESMLATRARGGRGAGRGAPPAPAPRPPPRPHG
ncbi:hypothetical protein ACFWH4_17810, partial [Streptomyces sp. NPDC127091]